ncbi:NAD(P)/FAD-dependent oxidoreductase [Xanthobacter sp. TB0139]|uniref:NAD(P)/FAD-dependent oxidoreductase n=1 Tax=Xanthobacter sp. TB0139 TaxID=3459178 RepID=UPI004039A485
MPRTSSPPHIAIIGSGPAGLAAAERLGQAGLQVHLHDRMPSPARKFLMAGRGGLNLTHSEPFPRFLARYGEAAERLEAALRAFPPSALQRWAEELGEPTFIGSSGRVFPHSFKASPLLRAWLARLTRLGVQLHPRHNWLGWSTDGALRFETPEGPVESRPHATILALGGASWPRLGSDGHWVRLLEQQGVQIRELTPSNMGIHLDWSDIFREKFAGSPLKRIAMSCGGEKVRGEAMVTRNGLEGGVIYALSRKLRHALSAGHSTLLVDLRPDLDVAALTARLAAAPRKLSFANLMRKAAGLSPVATGLVREVMGQSRPETAAELAHLIKALPLPVTGLAGISRAISSAGGIMWEGIGEDYELTALPGTFVCGEMMDWDAPTGGYLLQACFATGRAAAEGVLAHLTQTGQIPERRG